MQERLVMKKVILLIVLFTAGSLLAAGPLWATDNAKVKVGVLDESTFVVIQGRGSDDSNVLLYKVFDGKLHLIDTLVVDGDFTDVSRPTVRVLRANAK
jgi:hypothetical protein